MDLTLTRIEQLALRGIQQRQADLAADFAAFQQAIAERFGMPPALLAQRFQVDGDRLVPLIPTHEAAELAGQMDTWPADGVVERL